MVPGRLALDATSVLDREMFNEEKEEAWRNHFEELSDRELQALNPEVFCAGISRRATDELTRTRRHGRDCCPSPRRIPSRPTARTR